MKRLKLTDFTSLFPEFVKFNAETQWAYVTSVGNCDTEVWSSIFRNPDICQMLNIDLEKEPMGWFNSIKVNKLPVALVVEKVNRVMEILGMIDE